MKQSEAERDKAAFMRGATAYKKNIEEQMALPTVPDDMNSLD